MRTTLRLVFVVGLVGALAACSQIAPQAPGTGTLRTVDLASTSTLQPASIATQQSYGVQPHEFSPIQFGFGVDTLALQQLQGQAVGSSGHGGSVINRIPSKKAAAPFQPSGVTAPQMLGVQDLAGPASQSFEGLNHFDQRYANSGNQFSVEPPDQGLCAGNKYVMEAVNDVVKVFNQSDGSTALATADLNSFLGYAPAIVRSGPGGNAVYGPSVTDPSCVYDAGSQRWYLVTLTLAIAPRTGAFMGQNYLDIAVSNSSDPTGSWNIYHLNVTTDGQNCPCLGDYPHIGTDANGLYITTNNFPMSGNSSPGNVTGFNGAWVYAIDKAGLKSGRNQVNVVAMAATDPTGVTSYTMAPAKSVGSDYPTTDNGTEYFLSSVTADTPTGDQVVLWGLDGTDSLSTRHPRLALSSTHVDVTGYADPYYYAVPQKAGDVPLAEALTNNDFGYGDAGTQVEGPIATMDSRMLQTMYVNGNLYGALTTDVDNGAGFGAAGAHGSGVEWFKVTPTMGGSGVDYSAASNGVIAVSGVNLVNPAMTVNSAGKGAISLTAVGPDDYPSAAYIPFDDSGGTPVIGSLVVTNAGAGPQDGFTEYFLGRGRPRWGDYSAGAVDPSTGNLWLATEDIHQTCTYADYSSNPAGGTYTCGGTRSALANWSTQISEITP